MSRGWLLLSSLRVWRGLRADKNVLWKFRVNRRYHSSSCELERVGFSNDYVCGDDISVGRFG